MAIARINGGMLQSNLERNGSSISIDATAYFDVNNYRLAVGQGFQSPQHTLDILGNAHLGNLYIKGNTITTESGYKLDLGNVANINIAGGSTNYILSTDGAGNLSFVDANTIPAISTIYQEVGSNLTGNTISLGTPTDLSLTANTAYDGWTTSTKVTDAIDNLNQIALNLGQGTFVGNVQFAANSVAGASPKTIIFTGTASGNPNTYYWDFGDGNTYTSSTSTVVHTYNNTLGGLYSVYYRASNSSGTWGGVAASGAIGSVDDFTRTSYITLYTPNPIPGFTANTAYLNTGNVLLFTDTSTYETDYTVYWGDGTTTISSNVAPRTQKHTYTNSTGDTQYSILLQANSTTAGPSNVQVNSAVTTANVFSTHTPVITANVAYIINWEANGGGTVNFTNGTTTNPGNASVFGTGQRYNYWWSDGTANSNVQIGSGGATSGSYLNQTLAKLYTMTSAQNIAGANVTYNTQLQVYNGHSSSPFASSNVAITVVPSVRSNIQATASTVSDKTGDTALNGYIYTDYNGNDRSLFTFRTAAQNTTTFNWGWGDGTASGNITTGSGTTSANITNSYTSTGAKTANLTVWGAPNTISQSNSKSLTITINSNPAAPTALSGKTMSMSSSTQGTSPYLAANALDNTSGNIASAGTSVTRYTTTTPLVTNTITQANTSVSGTVTAYINRANAGGVGFSISSSGAQTNANLYVTGDADARSAISAATYPTGFYKVFDAYVSSALSNFGLGYNDVHLEHTTAGKTTNSIGFVKDDVTSVPSVITTSVTVSNVTATAIRTISGIPYYQTGGNIRIAGIQAYNWIGQTYYNGTPMSIAANATTAEGTTGTLVTTQTKTYAQLDGATTFLSTGIPKANTGNVISNTYTFGNIFVNIDGTAAAVGNINATLTSVNGASTAISIPTYLNVYSSAYTGFDETSIVSHAVGNTTVAKRIVLSSANVTTPVYANTGTNYYASAAFSSTSTVAGTTEAVVRWGNLRVNTTNYSSGYLPVGPDLSAGGDRTTTQSFKFALQRPILQNMKVVFTGRVAGMYIAAPGTKLTDTSNTLNGWLNANVAYAGSGFPGDNTGAGGNGSSGCAVGTAVPTSTTVANVAYILTLGSAGTNQSYANQLLFNVVLGPNDWVSNIYLGNYS
jgi:hypothetical protein